MKRIYLLRHAKADWSVEVAHDLARPLHKRGVRDARRVGQFLTALDQVPDLVVSSPAVRAAETARLAAEGGGWTSTVELTDELYDSPAWKVMRLARETAKGAESLLVVSHEPTCSETFSELIGQGSVRMATGALARFDLASDDWADLEPGAGTLAWMVTPKILGAG